MKAINLKQRWKALSEKAGIDKSQRKAVFGQIKEYYGEPHRKYHNLFHIKAMLELMDEYSASITHLFSFEFAIWFHDIIYQPLNKNNEEESAVLAEKILKEWGQPKETIDLVGGYIRSTAGHFPKIDSDECRLFLDLDLSILGKDEKTYKKYSKAIREEYNVYPDDFYFPARKKVMESFLVRERIYFTEIMKERFEAKARKNIRAEIGG